MEFLWLNKCGFDAAVVELTVRKTSPIRERERERERESQKGLWFCQRLKDIVITCPKTSSYSLDDRFKAKKRVQSLYCQSIRISGCKNFVNLCEKTYFFYFTFLFLQITRISLFIIHTNR